jgi:uncharacterized membrane protein SirB2
VIVTAWLTAGLALVVTYLKLHYVYRHRNSRKRFIRAVGGLVSLYIAVLYIFLGLGWLQISFLSASLGRVAILLLLSILAAEVIMDKP